MILEIYLFLFFLVNLACFYFYVTCLCMLHVFACCMFLHIIVRFHCMFLHVFACHYVFFISSRVKVRMRQDDFSGRSFHFGHVELFGNIKVYIGIYLCIYRRCRLWLMRSYKTC